MRIVLRSLALLFVVLLIALVVAYFAVQLPAPLAMPEQGVTLRGVTVVNPGRDRSPDRTLVVTAGRIASIDAADGGGGPYTGAYVLPGLADAHVHFPPSALPGQAELFAFLFLYHGITTVRDAGDVDATSSGPARDGIRAGDFPGPRVFACGPFVDGPEPLWKNSIVVEDAEGARRAAREIADAGFDCIKAYNELSLESTRALRAEASALGLPLIGHVPWRVRYEDARFDDVQHLIGVASPLADPEIRFPEIMAAWPATDDARLARIAAQSAQQGIANTPTLVVTERRAAAADYEAARSEADALLLPRFYRDVIWSPTEGTLRGVGPNEYALFRAAVEPEQRAVKALFDAGAPLRTGSDVLNPFVVPGASLWRELRLFVGAGLSPEEALGVSRDSANALAGGRTGFIEPGAPADLLVFREDPTRSLDALASLEAVVADGRLYRRDQLEAQLGAYREAFTATLYEAITVPLVRRALASTMRE